MESLGVGGGGAEKEVSQGEEKKVGVIVVELNPPRAKDVTTVLHVRTRDKKILYPTRRGWGVRDRDRQTDRESGTETDRQTDRQTETETETETETDRLTDRQRQRRRHHDRQTDGQWEIEKGAGLRGWRCLAD